MMKVAFSARGLRAYPHRWGQFATRETTRKVLAWAKAVGFDGFEVEDVWLDFYNLRNPEIEEFRRELESIGMPVAAFKAPGKSLCHPQVRDQNRKKLLRAVEIAALLRTDIISVSLPAPARLYNVPRDQVYGLRTSFGSSRSATEEDFQATAEALAQVADRAAREGIRIAIEVHQNSLADNSTSTLRLLDMVGRDNVGANPDLGNIYWTYEEPEESWEEAIQRLAPRSIWWHCKNMRRVHVPEVRRSFFVRTPLPDGDIDYRYAITAMHQAGYRGYILIEGAETGDQFYFSQRSLEYVRSVLAWLEGWH